MGFKIWNIPGLGWTKAFSGESLSGLGNALGKAGDWLSDKWDDFTGLNLAKYQQQMQEEMYEKYQSPAALMRQYKEAGLNPNLIYGSASAGIGHAPSFDTSNVMRGSEKVNTVLSMFSQVLGLKQAVYQVDASREAAEQSAVKTLSDRVNLLEKQGDLRLKNALYGHTIYDDLYARKYKDKRGNEFFVGPGTATSPFLTQYSQAYRSNLLNSAYRSMLSNVADYGINATMQGLKTDNYFGTPSIRSRNAMNSLKYRLSSEIGNLGTYGKLFISLLDLLK